MHNLIDDYDSEPWTINDFCIGRPLGRGKFGRVFLAKERKTEDELLVAIKILFKSMLIEHNSEDNFKHEVEIQSGLRHPNILSLYTWFHDEDRIYLVLEYALNGNLLDKLNDEGPFSDDVAATYTYQTTKALMHLHSLNIIHRDLKPENLLIGYFGEIKLADFGWAFRYESTLTKDHYKIAGTLDYLPPEMITKSTYDMKVDNWCLGVLIYEFLVGKTPFEAPTQNETYGLIANVQYTIPKVVKPLAKTVISKLLVKSSKKRIELDEVLNSIWIENYADKSETYTQ